LKTQRVKNPLLGDPSNQENDKKSVLEIIDEYQNHPSILKIKSKINTSAESNFHIKKATTKDINKVIKSLDIKKAMSRRYPPKISKNICRHH